MAICERIDEPRPTCTFTVHDLDGGVVVEYTGAIVDTTINQIGDWSSVYVRVPRYDTKKTNQSAIERDLQARIEAALAVLEDRGSGEPVEHLIKILKGRL